MKILIAGGSGFVGKYVTEHLKGDNDIYILGRNPNTKFSESLKGDELPYIFCDYSKEMLSKIIGEINPDAFVNLAAHRPEGKSENISQYYRNLSIAANIYEACFEKAITNVVDTSTRMVYSSDNAIPWSEEANVNPDTYYALSKLWAEKTASFFNKKGMKIKTLRLAQVIGLGEKQGFVLQTYLDNAREGKYLKVFGKLKGRRHYIYAKDAARAISTAVKKNDIGGVFNIGMLKTYTFLDLAKAVNQTFGDKSEIIIESQKSADESIYYMDIKKAQQQLGWEPQYSLEKTYFDIKNDLELYRS
jgi:UDP-glucose 4-epimerase